MAVSGCAPGAGGAGVCAESADGSTLSAAAKARKEIRLGMASILVLPADESTGADLEADFPHTGSGVPAAARLDSQHVRPGGSVRSGMSIAYGKLWPGSARSLAFGRTLWTMSQSRASRTIVTSSTSRRVAAPTSMTSA